MLYPWKMNFWHRIIILYSSFKLKEFVNFEIEVQNSLVVEPWHFLCYSVCPSHICKQSMRIPKLAQKLIEIIGLKGNQEIVKRLI